jgi:hypothetical protein
MLRAVAVWAFRCAGTASLLVRRAVRVGNNVVRVPGRCGEFKDLHPSGDSEQDPGTVTFSVRRFASKKSSGT